MVNVDLFKLTDVRNKLNQENIKLLDGIEKNVSVEFRVWNRQCYSAIVKKDNNDNPQRAVVLYYTPISQEKIAHELLHIKSELILKSTDLYEQNGMFSDHDFCERLIEYIEHTIIFQEYKDLGFDVNLFFENMNVRSDLKSCIDNMRMSNGTKYSYTSIKNYLLLCGYLLSFRVDNRCEQYKKQIKTKNLELYMAINNLFNDLDDLEICEDNKKFLLDAYKVFKDKIKSWLNKNDIDWLS